MIIVNKTAHNLPTKVNRKYTERREQALLEFRRHVPLGGDGKLQALTPEEEERLRMFDAEKHLSRPPRWNGIEFKFAPNGQPGSAYDIPASVANFLIEKYNRGSKYVCEMENDTILGTCAREELPKGVVPLRPNLDDPLTFSSESYAVNTPVGMQVVSAGYAEPPAPYDPKEVAVPVGTVAPAKGAPVPRKANPDEPVLNRP